MKHHIINKIIDTLSNAALAEDEQSKVLWIHDTDRSYGIDYIAQYIKQMDNNWIIKQSNNSIHCFAQSYEIIIIDKTQTISDHFDMIIQY